jgi:hypothetical protein
VAVVGEAHIIVRALTNRVKPQIEDAFSGLDGIGQRAGERLGESFQRGIKRGRGGGADDGLFSKSFLAEAEAARQKLNRLIQVGYFLGPAISGVVGAIGSLGAGLVSLITLLSRAAPAAIVLGGALASLGFAAGTLAAAFSGVGGAISAGMKAQGGAANNARGIERAQRRLNELLKEQEALRRGGAEFERRMAEGARRLADATQAAADAAVSAVRSGRAYEKAQDRARKAQERVTEAREEAKEALQQLRFELEGGAISEKNARLEFEKARESLQRVQDLPPNSRARQEAEIAFAEAELNLRKAIDRNSDLQKEETKASKAGVEGSQAVIDAKEAAADATLAVVEAGEDAARADQRALDAANAALEAQDALGANGEIIKKIQEDRLKLAQQIKDAEADLADLKKGAGAANAFADAMAKLSPEAQKFVRYMIDTFIPALDDLKAAAGRQFFPLLETALENLRTKLFPVLEPLMESMGAVLGEIAVNISEVITKTENLQRLERVWKTSEKLLGSFGKAAGNLYELFLILLDAAGPLIDRFGEFIERITGNWAKNAAANFDEIRDRFNNAGDIIARLGGIIGRLNDAFKSIGEAIMEGGAGELLLTYFEDAADSFATLMDNMNKDGSLGEYFLKATENATKVLDLLGNIVAEILKLGDDEGVGIFVDKLSEAVDIFGEIGGELNNSAPALGDFIVKFAELIKNLTGSGAINNFFTVLNGALDVVNKIFSNKIIAQLFVFTSGIFAVTRAFGLITKVGGFFGKALFGNITKVTGAFGGAATKVDAFGGRMAASAAKGGMFAGAFGKASGAAGGLSKGLRLAGGAFKALLGPIGLILLAIEFLLPVFQKLYAENENFRNAVDGVVQFITGLFQKFMEIIMQVWEAIQPVLQAIATIIEEVIGAAITYMMDLWNELYPLIQELWAQLQPIFKIIGEVIDTVITQAVIYLQEAFKAISEIVMGVWDFVKPIFGFIADIIGKYIVFQVKNLITIIKIISSTVQFVWNFVRPIFNLFAQIIRVVIVGQIKALVIAFNTIKSTVTAVYSFIKPIFDKIGSAIKTVIGGAIDVVKGIFNGLKDTARGVFNGIAGVWNNTVGKLSFKIPGWVPGIGGKGFDVPDIPTLAKGGVVPASLGGTLALLAEAGRPERIEPLDPDGLSRRDKALINYLSGGGAASAVTVNVFPSPGMNERELAQKVSRELASMMRKGAA